MEAIKKMKTRSTLIFFLILKFKKPFINKFNVVYLVRIIRSKGVFDKGYLTNYRTKLFQIAAVKNTTPITYELLSKTGELIKGVFYEKELSKVIH